MENIFEIALESAYGDWNEPLLESENNSVKNKVIVAVKKFFESVRDFFRKMIARVKKVFGKDGNDQSSTSGKADKDQSSSTSGNVNLEINDDEIKAKKAAIDKLKNEIESLTEKIEKVRKEVSDLIDKQSKNNLKGEIARDNEKGANTRLESLENLLDIYKSSVNACEREVDKRKNEINDIDNYDENIKKYEETLNDKASKIPFSASEFIKIISKMVENMNKAYSIIMNVKDPKEAATTLSKILDEVKIPDAKLKASDIEDMPYSSFKTKSEKILKEMWNDSKLEQVKASLVKKIESENPDASTNSYKSMCSSLNQFINRSSKLGNIAFAIQDLYKYSTYSNPKYNVDPASREETIEKLREAEKELKENQQAIRETEQEIKKVKSEISKAKADQESASRDNKEYDAEQTAKQKELDEMQKKREEKKRKLRDDYGVEESVDIFSFNL